MRPSPGSESRGYLSKENEMKLCSLTFFVITGLILAAHRQSATAQTVEIPDPDLKSAIWGALGRPLPAGTVTVPDMLSLINLDAAGKHIRSLEGLGEAH